MVTSMKWKPVKSREPSTSSSSLADDGGTYRTVNISSGSAPIYTNENNQDISVVGFDEGGGYITLSAGDNTSTRPADQLKDIYKDLYSWARRGEL